MRAFCDLRVGDIVKMRTPESCIIVSVAIDKVFVHKGVRYFEVKELDGNKRFHMSEYVYIGECSPEEEFVYRMEN